MQTLSFSRPFNPSLLHDELVRSIPGFHRAVTRQDPDLGSIDEATPDCGRVESSGDLVRLTFADDISPEAVTLVVNAHDPTKTQPDPRKERLARVAELLAIARSDWTTAQFRELLQLVAQETTQ